MGNMQPPDGLPPAASAVPPAMQPPSTPPPAQAVPEKKSDVEEAKKFAVGFRVKLKGLKKNPDFNGALGTVLDPSEGEPLVAGTVKVRLDMGPEVAAKPGNLDIVDPRYVEGAEDQQEAQEEKAQEGEGHKEADANAETSGSLEKTNDEVTQENEQVKASEP